MVRGKLCVLITKEWVCPTLCFLCNSRPLALKGGKVMAEPAFKKEDLSISLRHIIENLGYECVGIVFAKESNNLYIKVYLDVLGGITVKDCETVSRSLSRFLDKHDSALPNRYFLEVGSAGLDRPLFTLDDYARFEGKKAKIRCLPTKEGRKRFKGIISSVNEEKQSILIQLDDSTEEEEIPFDLIQKGNLVYEGE